MHKKESSKQINGIGVDIKDISRFEAALNNNKDLFNHIFTKKELDYCFSKKNPAQHLAARFSAKEAIIKALSNAVTSNIQPREIEILNNEEGVPSVLLHQKNEAMEQVEVNLSMSHCEDRSIAFAIVTKKVQ